MEQTLTPAPSPGTASGAAGTSGTSGMGGAPASSGPAAPVNPATALVPLVSPGIPAEPGTVPGLPDAPTPPDTPGASAVARSAADYAFDLPDHLSVDTAVADRFRALCAAQGLTPEQARAAVNFYVAEHEAVGGLAADGCEAGLRTLWKGRYDERIDTARRAVRSLDARMEGRLAPLVRAGLGNHPAFAELMSLVGERMGEDSLGAGTGPAGARGEAMSTEDFLRTVVFAKR
ncbi:hypothetical protein [Nitratidesulfovibrio liaohensis]|uniref:Uncharacterized protein n=1 Tax=Nitratidesulfovibrio liaohensis TaxID=2604158 RepID=A0ABY9R4Q1_9BACT|nr:hypothetical protein [Nitratidesulfovibrio liaohensis]WMW66725.1 hypothetical protein KPS_001337 [Nitratidesulfovibrio liaohensis]